MKLLGFLCVSLGLMGCGEGPPSNPSLDASLDASLDSSLDASLLPLDASGTDGQGTDLALADSSLPRLRVLFIGNSYTYVNDLPALLVAFGALGSGPRIAAESVTEGGATLSSHWAARTALLRIMEGGWTAVVLQGQSLEPALSPAVFHDYALRFGRAVQALPSRPVFYATWPRREGDEIYTSSFSGGSPRALNERLDRAYSAAATELRAEVAHVGDAWMTSLRLRPTINLYADDGSHPSPAGTFLAGCVLYRRLTGLAVPPEADRASPGLSPEDARALREISAMP